MPPASPVPGWSSGEVCRLIIAIRRIFVMHASSGVGPVRSAQPARAGVHSPAARLAFMSTRKRAVVTGASSGIGAATARRLAAEGYDVVCAARRANRIEALAAEIGGTPVTCDVTDAEDVAALAEVVGSRLDVLVNNAGGAI